jgi:hypothetical protein
VFFIPDHSNNLRLFAILTRGVLSEKEISVTLLLHTGAEPIEYDALRDLPIPAATLTHVPIPHHRVVDMLVHTLSFYGHEVIEQHHGITKDGLRYFGLLSLQSPYTGYTDTVGLRNFHDNH